MFMQSTRYSCQILIKLQFCRQILRKYSNTKLHDNPSSGSRVIPCERADGRTDRQTDRQTEMTKLIVAFRNFAKSPNIKVRFTNVKLRNIINIVVRC